MLSNLRECRNDDRELAAVRLDRAISRFAAEILCDAPHDVEPQARARSDARRVTGLQALEERRALLGGNTVTVVFDREHDGRAVVPDIHGNGAALGRPRYGVRDKV